MGKKKEPEVLKPTMNTVDEEFLQATYKFFDDIEAAAEKYETVIQNFKDSQLYDIRIMILQMKKAFVEAREELNKVKEMFA